MRVVSLVPSWTETLIAAGVDVVGRTRFCIHPKEKVATIPRVGGTKDWDFEKIKALKPDLLILDQEENPKFMSEQSEIPYYASHIHGIEAMPGALAELSTRLQSENLARMSQDWVELIHRAPSKHGVLDLPGVVEWGVKPTTAITRIVYVIWKEPWMRVGRATFIGSVLRRFGVEELLDSGAEKYPQFDLSVYPTDSTLLLFSTEPFPFLRHKAEIHRLGFPHAFVDGEKYSWFGVRAFEFLTNA